MMMTMIMMLLMMQSVCFVVGAVKYVTNWMYLYTYAVSTKRQEANLQSWLCYSIHKVLNKYQYTFFQYNIMLQREVHNLN